MMGFWDAQGCLFSVYFRPRQCDAAVAVAADVARLVFLSVDHSFDEW